MTDLRFGRYGRSGASLQLEVDPFNTFEEDKRGLSDDSQNHVVFSKYQLQHVNPFRYRRKCVKNVS